MAAVCQQQVEVWESSITLSITEEIQHLLYVKKSGETVHHKTGSGLEKSRIFFFHCQICFSFSICKTANTLREREKINKGLTIYKSPKLDFFPDDKSI